MFTKQEEESQKKKRWHDDYKLWYEENKCTHKFKGYIDNKYLTHILDRVNSESKKDDELSTIFAEIVDLMVRKCIAMPVYIVNNSDVKSELYSVGILAIYKNVSKYTSSSGKAHAFINTVITNSFKDYFNMETKYNKSVSSKMLSFDHATEFEGMTDSQTLAVESYIKKENEYELNESMNISTLVMYPKKEEPTVDKDTPKESLDFYDEFLIAVETQMMMKDMLDDAALINYQSLRLLTSENLPSFKRKYKIFNRVMNLTQTKIDTSDYRNITDEKKKELFVIEMLHLSQDSENEGGNRHKIHDRVLRVRNNGYQYFGVYSDDWYYPDIEQREVYRDILVTMFVKMVYDTWNPTPSPSKNFDVSKSYIEPRKFMKYHSDGYSNNTFYALDAKRDKRHFIDQTVEAYIKWLGLNNQNTRIYDFGHLKIK